MKLRAFALAMVTVLSAVSGPWVGLAGAAAGNAPTAIGLSSSSVAQSAGNAAAVGTLSASDPDDTSHTFSLVSGTGDTDNDEFSIDSATLRATDARTLTEGSYSVRIAADDGNDGTYAQSVSVTVVDDIAPTVTAASVDGTTLSLSLDDELSSEASTIPPGDVFTVTASGTTVDVSDVAVSGSTIPLTLSDAVSATDTVTVGYSLNANGIRDTAGNRLAEFGEQSVTNDTPESSASTGSGTTDSGTESGTDESDTDSGDESQTDDSDAGGGGSGGGFQTVPGFESFASDESDDPDTDTDDGTADVLFGDVDTGSELDTDDTAAVGDGGDGIEVRTIEPESMAGRDEDTTTEDIDVQVTTTVRATVSTGAGLIASRRAAASRDELRTIVDRPESGPNTDTDQNTGDTGRDAEEDPAQDDQQHDDAAREQFLDTVADGGDSGTEVVEVTPTRPPETSSAPAASSRVAVDLGTRETDTTASSVQSSVTVVDTRQLSGTSRHSQSVEISGAGNIVVRGSGIFRGTEEAASDAAPDVDNVLGDNSQQVLFFGPGNDTIWGVGGDDTVTSAGGADRLYGGTGDDRVGASAGDNAIFGGPGDDTVVSGTGDDLLDGGPGIDTAQVNVSRGSVVFQRTTNGTVLAFHGTQTDRLRSVERVAFGNGDQFALTTNASGSETIAPLTPTDTAPTTVEAAPVNGSAVVFETTGVQTVRFAGAVTGTLVITDRSAPTASVVANITDAVATTSRQGTGLVGTPVDIRASTDSLAETPATVTFSVPSDAGTGTETPVVVRRTDTGWEPLATTVEARTDDGMTLHVDTETASVFAVVATEHRVTNATTPQPATPDQSGTGSPDTPTADSQSSTTFTDSTAGTTTGSGPLSPVLTAIAVLGGGLLTRRRIGN